MSSVIPCPSCQSPLAVTPELAGQMIACPACGQRIQLAKAVAAKPTTSKGKPGRAASQVSPAILASWGVVGVLIVVAGILVWQVRVQQEDDAAQAAAASRQPAPA